MAAEETLESDSGIWPWMQRIGHWIGRGLLALMLLLAAAVVFLHTGPGRQFIVDRISKFSPASGLSISVGRISGSVLWNASFYDVQFRDADGSLFLKVPEVELNWRPYKFPFSGLDVRNLVLHDGQLYARPHLKPGDPNAPILPNFDIRVDRFVIDNLHVAKGLLGEERKVDFRARADVRKGKVLLDANGELGGGDKLALLVDAEPDGNKFDLDLDYRAPKGGLLASLVGAKQDLRLKLDGDGTWSRWDGSFVGTQGGKQLADLKIANRNGRYSIVGPIHSDGYLKGIAARALGKTTQVSIVSTLENSIANGAIVLRGGGLDFDAKGAIDFGNNAFQEVAVSAAVRDPALLGSGIRLETARLTATLDGPFRKLTAQHHLTAAQADLSGTVLKGIDQRGTLRLESGTVVLPLDARAGRVVSGNTMIDPHLVHGTLRGQLILAGGTLRSNDLRLGFPGIDARLTLSGDPSRSGYELAGPVNARGLALDNLGKLNAGAQIRFKTGGGAPWSLSAKLKGQLSDVTNGTVSHIAGDDIHFAGDLMLGSTRPVEVQNASIESSKLLLTVTGGVSGGETKLQGSGKQANYGAFTFDAAFPKDGPHANLLLESPLPAAGLKQVHVALAPSGDGFAIDTDGQSLLGPFMGKLQLALPSGGPVGVTVRSFTVSDTDVSGMVSIANGAASGTLALVHGGLDGTIALSPRSGGQGVDVDLKARSASFGGATPLTISRASLTAKGTFGGGQSVFSGQASGQGVGFGRLFVGHFTGQAESSGGKTTFDAALTGQRGSGFELQLTGSASSQQIAMAVRGSYDSQAITMPRRAVLAKLPDGGWELRPTQLNYGDGTLVAEASFGGSAPATGKLSLAKMPLSLVDSVGGDLGLGGTISGLVELSAGPNGAPTGEAKVMVKGLTRSGLLLTSRPIDLALVSQLSPTMLQTRAVLQDSGGTKGRLQGRIAMLKAGGSLFERLQDGDLQGQLRYEGPADSLWRLAAVDAIDLQGPVRVTADVHGSLRAPEVDGTIAGDELRVQSALTGTDIKKVRARGRFSGSLLQLTSFSGTGPSGGMLSGSGTVDLSNMAPGHGPALDLRLAAKKVRILDLPTMGATVTGPIRIVSSGVGGTIAGRLHVDSARWRLGAASASEQLPNIRTKEINVPADVAPVRRPGTPWRFLIDAVAPGQVKVDGMGLDSEWSANIRLRGTTADPRIGGSAVIVPRQGFYSFAGTRFDITRGKIDFDEDVPPDPRIDLVAQTTANGLTVTVSVTGRAARPEISFSSTPALPEEEILARLLFGGSISNLSATDALQLGAALASLRGGGGIDPINKLRQAVGLDRLRIVPADPALNQGTALALGKNIGRKLYVELITDGRGYSATDLEFRITSWLALLGTVSSLGRESATLEYSKDY